ncbi:outer membrane beta-barrel protein [Motiliproteus sediminis]|uniref:outer membrane beta-barrel protein n=1 Tax=Motiliproteus sediminis TaxID=1468178 RepID=UPI001AEF8971|nr:outer membrane beta-barrel protein [Motiliproteus sediminis]
MLRPLITSLCLALASLVAPAGHAAELTPFAGISAGGNYRDTSNTNSYRIDHGASGGVSLLWDSAPDKGYELLYSHQDTHIRDVDISLQLDYLHFGGLYYFQGQQENWSPYVAGGLGITRVATPGRDSDLLASMNLALGGRWRISEQFGVRLELRAFGSLTSSTTLIECGTGCRIEVEGDALYQVQGSIGVGYRF